MEMQASTKSGSNRRIRGRDDRNPRATPNDEPEFRHSVSHPDEDTMTSPRTSFCLLEATAEDRDSAVSSTLTPHSPRVNDHAAPIGSTTNVTAATPPRRHATCTRNITNEFSPSAVLRSPRKTPYTSSSATTAPAMLQGDESIVETTGNVDANNNDEAQIDDSMRGLFRVDSKVFANPDNIAPSLQTSIIMGESQIVGQNGTLASLYPGKRRQRRAVESTAQDTATIPIVAAASSHHSIHDQFAHLQQHHQHTGDTVESTAGGESPNDPAGSDDYSTRGTSVVDATPHSGWHRTCCCLSGKRGRHVPSEEYLTLSQFLTSLYARMHMTWDSQFLFFTLALAIVSIPLAVGVSVVLKSSENTTFRARCQFRSSNHEVTEAGVTTASLASVLIPMMNHIVLLVVSLWIAIHCSHSRKRVLKSSHTSTTATLTSAFMLPCFEFIWYTISFLNLAGIVFYLVSFYPTSPTAHASSGGSNDHLRLRLDDSAQYPCELVEIPFTWMLQLLPFLMAQRSVSHEAVRRAIAFSGLICLCIVVLQLTLFKEGYAAMGLICIGVHLLLLAFYGWAKFLSHARSSFDFFFVIAVVDSITTIAIELVALGHGSAIWPVSSLMIGQCVVMSLDAILTVAILLSLRADTRYWLGIDDSNASVRHPFKQYMRHLSERGMITNFSTRTSVYDVHRMIEEHRKSVVDFSALKLECVIGQGATSIVMRGVLRPHRPIALKIYTSVQVTDEEVQRFSRETALNVQLSHPNIVKFYGLCVVPPSISLVFEFCEYGGLDSVLRNGSMTSLSTKLRAWLDACRAVAYLHSFSPPLLHRDIKTDNFLVGQDFTLKLADFGEANLLRPRSDGTMTIAGTVDYMAPEMILGGKTARYGTGVDVYSLMVTLWQIMVPDCSPWEGRSHLEVYTCVTNGERPPLLPSIPSGCAEILEAGWVANPSERVAVEDILPKVHQLWLLSTHQKTLKRTK